MSTIKVATNIRRQVAQIQTGKEAKFFANILHVIRSEVSLRLVPASTCFGSHTHLEICRKDLSQRPSVWLIDEPRGQCCVRLRSEWCGFEPWPGTVVLSSWATQSHLTLTVPLFTHMYKYVPTNLMLGMALRWAPAWWARIQTALFH